MGLQIQDGTGSSYALKINKDGQAHTVTESHDLMFHQSLHFGQAYSFVEVQGAVVTQNTEVVLAHIKNTSKTRYLCINHVYVSSLGVGTGLVRLYVGSVYGSGGSSYTPPNHNLVSGNVAEATVNISATGNLITASGGSQVCTKAIIAEHPTAEMNFDGSIILGLNNTFDVRMLEGNVGTPTIAVCVEGFYIDI